MVKTHATIRFLAHINIDLDTKMVILSALVQKLWSKRSFCKMVANVMLSCTSNFQTAQDIFHLFESPGQSHLCYLVTVFVQQEPRYDPKCVFIGF